MNNLFDHILDSNLYSDEVLRKTVMTHYYPSLLLNTYGYDKLDHNLPENYKKTSFAVWLSSRFIYKYGSQNNVIDFIDFVNKVKKGEFKA